MDLAVLNSSCTLYYISSKSKNHCESCLEASPLITEQNTMSYRATSHCQCTQQPCDKVTYCDNTQSCTNVSQNNNTQSSQNDNTQTFHNISQSDDTEPCYNISNTLPYCNIAHSNKIQSSHNVPPNDNTQPFNIVQDFPMRY